MNPNSIINSDCLEGMRDIRDNSVDLVICDLPYGVTACKWDSKIPMVDLWSHYNRVCKKNAPVILFGTQPFVTTLINSNPRKFKYNLIWVKNFSTNFLHAKRMPLRKMEEILVFYSGQPTYNPIKSVGHIPTQSARGSSNGVLYHGTNRRNSKGGETTRFPTNILNFDAVDPKKRIHPTQKPVELLEYLVKTYTNEGETVLDNCIGSGSTAIACMRSNRNYIGFEMDGKYFDLCMSRILGEMSTSSPDQQPLG